MVHASPYDKLIFPIGLSLTLAMGTAADLASSINMAALQAFQDSNLVIRGEKVVLYGVQTNGADTKGGKYGCAKVVSVTLRKAGVDIPITLGVSGIETKLGGWRRIGRPDSLRPGDVIVWISRFKGNENGACTGGGTCHVGIVSEKGYFHNNPLGHTPIFNGVGLKFGYRFKAAYRPPDEAQAGGE